MWVTPSVAERAQTALPWPVADPAEPIGDTVESLVAIGGGRLLDQAKFVARDCDPELLLVAIPSIWGSGAEVSPVVYLEENGAVERFEDEAYLPDHLALWPELAASIPAERAKQACGDCWVHALEGFLSPLSDDELEADLADLIQRMTDMELTNDSAWYEISSRACVAQARSSVGLVHGIAHTIERPLRTAQPDFGWSHARLASAFAWPVMAFNREGSDKWPHLVAQFHLDEATIDGKIRNLYDEEAYNAALPVLKEHWPAILKDPATRTNCTLVRPNNLSYFENRQFMAR